jgi:Bacterial Ig-like domain (group 1)
MRTRIFTFAVVATLATSVHAQQVLNFSTPNPNMNGWTVTAGGAVNAVPFVFEEDLPSYAWSGNVISITSNGLSTGTFLSGGNLANFDGFWTASYTFYLPSGARNVNLNYSGLFADDRVVLELNGTPIGSAGLKGPGQGKMVFSDGGLSVLYSFSVPTSSGPITMGFNVGGQNTLTAIINNTDGGINGGLTSIASSSGDHTGFAVNGTISYNTASLPIITTGGASSITANSATLNGSVNPNGSATTAYFQWGTSTNYGNTVPNPALSCGSGNNTIGVSVQSLSGLAPSTTYHYRLVASSSAGIAYGGDQTFITLSAGTPLPVISSTYSTLVLTPTSQPADGSSQITATATLRDVNDNPITGRTIEFSAAGQATVKIANSTVTTDSSGKATTTITATTPGTSTIVAVDLANVNIIASATASFTPQGFILPNTDFGNAITALYQDSAGPLVSEGSGLSISSVATNAGALGDSFRNGITEDEAAIILDAVFGVEGAISTIPDTTEYASMLAQPGVVEVGPNISSPQLSYLIDNGLVHAVNGNQILQSALKVVIQEAFQEAQQAGIVWSSDFYISSLNNIAADPNSPSSLGNDAAESCVSAQQALQQLEQTLLNKGVPATLDQANWTANLQSRYLVGYTFQQVLLQQKNFLQQEVNNKLQANQQWNDWFAVRFGLGVAAGLIGDGPGNLLVGGIFTIASEYKNGRDLSSDQVSYLSAISLLIGCLQYSGQTYLNTASTYSEISNNLPSEIVTARTGPMTDVENGYATIGLLGLQSVFSATNAYSSISVTNTSSEPATFEIFVLSSYSGSTYGVPISNLAQVNFIAATIPAGSNAILPILYYDGENGGIPDNVYSMEIYVLGNNRSGTFYIDSFNHDWNPIFMTNGSVWQPLAVREAQNSPMKPLGNGGSSSNNVAEIENPVSTYVMQNPSNQTYQTEIFVVNPFGQTCSAIVTQALPLGINVLATDGMSEDSAIVWTNTISTNVVEDAFTFTLPVAPGAQTNLPPPTVTFVDQSSNQSSPFHSTTAGFNGLFPVQVSSSISAGILGVDSTMSVAVTNLTGTSQSGSLTIALADSSENSITNFSESFSLDGSGSTNLSFTLPGSLPPGTYTLTGSLSINGGTGQVLAGNYVVPAPPVALNLDSTPALTTNGLNLALQGPAGNYLIEASSDLSSSTNWQPVAFYSSTNASFYYNFTVPTATNTNQQFYRAVIQ